MQKKIVFLLLLPAFYIIVTVFTSVSIRAANWPQFKFNPVHTGYSATESFPAPHAEESWSFTGTPGVSYSSPIIIDSKLYIGSIDGNLYCFDVNTKQEQWHKFIGGSIYATPAGVLLNGKIYVFVCTTNGKIYAISATDSWGSVIQIKKTIDIGTGIYASPTIAQLVVNGQTVYYLYVASNDGTVYCYDVTGISQNPKCLVG